MKPATYTVDPIRLASGGWSTQQNRQIGEGDIARSYSADTIAIASRIRKPFRFQNRLWVGVGLYGHHPACILKAYQIMKKEQFLGESTTYDIKICDSKSARQDPDGFYHGMAVKYGGRSYILVGPPVEFVAGKQAQLDLLGW